MTELFGKISINGTGLQKVINMLRLLLKGDK